MRKLVIFTASGGFLGYAPVASGTFGTLAGIPLFWAFAALESWSSVAVTVVFVLFVAASCAIAGRAEEVFGEHDSSKIVIDEIAGYLAATLYLDFDLATVVIAFFAFRLFDIVKPYPANRIDRDLPGGPGVVMDDVVAGIYANLLTRVVLLLL